MFSNTNLSQTNSPTTCLGQLVVNHSSCRISVALMSGNVFYVCNIGRSAVFVVVTVLFLFQSAIVYFFSPENLKVKFIFICNILFVLFCDRLNNVKTSFNQSDDAIVQTVASSLSSRVV